MAEIVVSPLLGLLFTKLASSANTALNAYLLRNKRIKELPETIARWKNILEFIESMISDAERQQFGSQAIQKWLHDLQDWAYDLEDILDGFATDARLNELKHEFPEEEDSSAACGCIPCTKVSRDLTQSDMYSTRIEVISNRLHDIQTRVKDLGLVREALLREKWEQKRAETSSLVGIFYGRDDEKDKIIKKLLVDEPFHGSYIVIPITGIGGIGKTALAQSVYNDEHVKDHFDLKVWVCVSQVFNVKQITTSIVNSACSPTFYSFSNLSGAQEKLRDILVGKRFLIALDDVWNEEYEPWEQLQVPFRAGKQGSRVIVTTRLEKAAKNTPSLSPIIRLKILSDDDCWLIFKQHALICDDPTDQTRTQVVNLSNGLPLAAKALGGLLKKNDKSEWSTILSSNVWSEVAGVLPALRLSYYHLPHHLKRIFAYCSIFPKDHEFCKDVIILMWMAEGFLPDTEEESMENNGDQYLADLVSRSLFEPIPSREGYFIMHDLIHDLAQWAAKVLERPHVMREIIGAASGQLRTLTFVHPKYYFFPLTSLESALGQFQCLRVLCLADMCIAKLPDTIGNLKHLRLLDVSSNEILQEFPQSLSKLCNLQTLLLMGCNFFWMVFNIEHFIELRHLNIEDTHLSEMPFGIGKLTKLRTLKPFFLQTKHGHRIGELENLNYLGSLDIYGLENIMRVEDAKRSRLNEKLHLQNLRLFWAKYSPQESTLSWVERKVIDQSQLRVERHVLEHLQPPTSIKELELHKYMGLSFPTWLGTPSFDNMVVIRLKGCSRCEWLPPLGQLPSLKDLLVEGMHAIKYVGLEFYGFGHSNPFPALITLRFNDMKNWKKWCTTDNRREFPCLEKLSIMTCPLLQGNIPYYLPSLRKLKITTCDKMKVLLPRCPMLEKLIIISCRELSSIEPVICCSNSVRLHYISSFSGFEGFRVPSVETILVVDTYSSEFRVDANIKKLKHIYLVRCPKLLSWQPDAYGELTCLTDITIGNCEEWTIFLENKFPSRIKRLRIYYNNYIHHLSTLTMRSTCLEELHIKSCPSVATINNLPSTLKVLEISNVEIKQPAKEWGLHHLTYLKKLIINYPGSSADLVESIPGPDLYLPSSLSELSIHGFNNLKFFSCSTLPNLREVLIEGYPLTTRKCVNVSP